MSSPSSPTRTVRNNGRSPSNANAGRPATSYNTSPSTNSSPIRGISVTTGDTPSKATDVTVMLSGCSKRTVPRVTTSFEITISSTGTVINDGTGGSVSAATCSGDLIWAAATQPTTAIRTT